jgi:hypothetical protein
MSIYYCAIYKHYSEVAITTCQLLCHFRHNLNILVLHFVLLYYIYLSISNSFLRLLCPSKKSATLTSDSVVKSNALYLCISLMKEEMSQKEYSLYRVNPIKVARPRLFSNTIQNIWERTKQIQGMNRMRDIL